MKFFLFSQQLCQTTSYFNNFWHALTWMNLQQNGSVSTDILQCVCDDMSMTTVYYDKLTFWSTVQMFKTYVCLWLWRTCIKITSLPYQSLVAASAGVAASAYLLISLVADENKHSPACLLTPYILWIRITLSVTLLDHVITEETRDIHFECLFWHIAP